MRPWSIATNIGTNGIETIYSGGTAIDDRVTDGGAQVILAGGKASNSLLSGSATIAELFVQGGGAASDTTVYQSGLLYVDRGGTASDTVIGGGQETVLGADLGARISGGTETVFGTATGATVFADALKEFQQGRCSFLRGFLGQ